MSQVTSPVILDSTGQDIADALTDVADAINAGNATAAMLAYVENGSTATQSYAKGTYICWKGLLYTADTTINTGDTFYSTGVNKNLTAVGGGGFNKLAPVFGTWTPNSNATVIVADRCFYMISGGFLLINVAIILVNNLSNRAEVDIISNLSETFGRTLRTNAIFSTAALTFNYYLGSKLIRIQVGNNKLYIRNDSGSNLTSDDSIYGQIMIPVY